MAFLDEIGLAHLWNQIIARLSTKIEHDEITPETWTFTLADGTTVTKVVCIK